MERVERRTPRYMFFASAELIEDRSGVQVASRVSELSLHGCYLDMMNPFPLGTSIRVKIWTEQNTVFESKGRIIYAQPNMGAGVRFEDVDPKDQAVLVHWLEDVAKST